MVKVCAKAGIGRKVGHKKRVFLQIFKNCLKIGKLLIVQDNFVKFIDVVRRNYVVKAFKWEMSDRRCTNTNKKAQYVYSP